jgi:tetratricopeptide (TPR) repeat protein
MRIPVRVVLAALALAAPAWAAEVGPVRFPDLAGLEDAVARQISEMQALLVARTADSAAVLYGDLGQVYLAYGFNDAAADCFRNAAAVDARDQRWPYLLGASRQAAGELDGAAAAFEQALQLAPGTAAGHVHLAEIRLLQGRPEEAEAAARKALDTPATAAAARSVLGQAALARRDFKAAVEHLEAALAAVPAANRLHYPLALAYRGLGDRTKAEEHLARAGQVGLKPADPLLDGLAGLRVGERVALMRGRVAAQAGRPADAAEEFRRALVARPESVEARVNLGSMLVLLGDPGGGIEQFREALQRDPANVTARFNLGALLAESAPGEAREHLAAVVAARPDDGEARALLARLLRDSGSLGEALAQYARAVELDPANEAARLGEAETLVRFGRYGEAKKKLEEALRQLPASGLLSHAMARLLAAAPDRSVRDGAWALTLALAVWNAQPAPAYAETVALAFAELDRCDEAAQWQRKAIEEWRRLGQEGPIGDLQRALSAYEKGSPCRP